MAKVRAGKRYSVGGLLVGALFVAVFFFSAIPADNVSAWDSGAEAKCIKAAKAKFKVNSVPSGNPKPYSTIADIASGSNEHGVNWACSAVGPHAVVWLADSDGWSKSGDVYTINANVLFPRSGKVTAYVVGSVRNQKTDNVYATRVRLCSTTDAANSNDSSKCWSGVGIEKKSGWMSVGSDYYCTSSYAECFLRSNDGVHTDDYYWSDPKGAKITIDMDKFLSKSTPTLQGSTYDQYTIYMHRRYNKNGSDGVSPVRINVEKAQESTYTGSVSATIQDLEDTNNKATSNTDTPGADQTVTITGDSYEVSFTHKIKRTDSGNFSVSHPWSISATPKAANLYSENAKGSNRSDTLETKSAKTYTITIDSDTAPTTKYRGKLYAGQSITYCETLNYKSSINGTAMEDASTKACIIVKRANATCSSLQGDLSDIKYSHNKGYNYGQIGVTNKTLGIDYQYYGSKDITGSASIYARPGDEVRFQHNFCAGGYYARATGAKETLSGGYRYSGTSDSSNDAGVKSRYLFGEQVSTWQNESHTSIPRNQDPEKMDKMNMNGVNDSTILDKTIVSSRTSPGENNYYNDCPTAGNTTKTEGYYKLAGGTNASNCNNRVQTLDTGHTITQSLTWNNLGYENGTRYGNGEDVTASASVKVPYNYIAEPYVTNDSSLSAFVGEDVTMSPGVVITSRKNIAFAEGKDTYATISKPSRVEVRAYFTTASGSLISETPYQTLENYRLNKNGNVAGTGTNEGVGSLVEDGGAKLNTVTVNLDDSKVSVGDKVCVEVRVYPRDSHDAPDAATVYGGAAVEGGAEIALSDGSANPSNWAVATSCSTIAKRPTMSVESSNTYSATSYQVANYTKKINNVLYNFGSWGEYGVFGRQTNKKLFASGAALGYSLNGYSGNGVNLARANVDDGSVSTSSNSGDCTFMTQTFANADCKSKDNTIGGATATQYSERLKSRYGSLNDKFIESGIPTKTYAGKNYLDLSGYSGSDVIVEDSGVVSFNLKNNAYISSLPNISDAQIADKGITNRNRTIVYYAPEHTIVVDGDINPDSSQKSALGDLTQVLIIAKNVYITDRPTYINAIILADNVNTCRFANGVTTAVNGKGGASSELSSAVCNQTLRFDAPVVAKKIVLNRTAGADRAEGTIRRAEIFNLNMTNYLWSYGQMSRLSQAVTTYSRELPPRY